MKFKNILVPVDLSEYSDKAMEYALHLYAQQRRTLNLTFLYVNVAYHVEQIKEGQIEEYRHILEKKAQRIWEEHLTNGKNPPVFCYSVEIIEGSFAAESILHYLRKRSFDLVIMGTHGRTGLPHILLGSVAERVVRMSPVPVLTVHHSQQKFTIEKILVPIDFSECSKQAIELAIPIVEEFKTQLMFLHVIAHEFQAEIYGTGMESIFTIDSDLKQRATRKLVEFVDYRKASPDYRVLEGKPHQAIAEFAREYGADLIIMATRGLTGLKHLLVGSTTERVVRTSHCPVLTVCRDQKSLFDDP